MSMLELMYLEENAMVVEDITLIRLHSCMHTFMG